MAKSIGEQALGRGLNKIVSLQKKLERHQVVYIDVERIHPNPWNPNQMSPESFDLLCRSMVEDGFVTAVVLRDHPTKPGEFEIIDGEHRWRGGRKIGMAQIPCVVIEQEQATAMLATLAFNRAHGAHDVALEADLFRDLRELGSLGWAAESLGLSDARLEQIMSDVPAADQLAATDFGEAWAPTQGQGDTETATNTPVRSSASDAALELNERLQAKMDAATNDAERQVIEKQRRANTMRIQTVFSSEDAVLVRSVLEESKKPAEKLLQLCLAEKALREAAEASA